MRSCVRVSIRQVMSDDVAKRPRTGARLAKSGRKGREVRKILMAAAVATILNAAMVPGHAAVNTAVAVPGSFAAGYATPRLVIHKGAPATFVNLDVEEHDVRSVAMKPSDITKPLFASAIIGTGKTAPIEGIAGTSAGDYAFFCVVHTDMKGTIKIVG